MTQNYYSGVGSDPIAAFQAQQAYFQSHPGAGGQDYQPTPITLTGTIVGIMDTTQNNYQIRVPLDWARGMEENQMAVVTQADQDAAQAKCRNSHTPGSCNTSRCRLP
ncbi:MAG: hypothetical protein WDN27_00125 [Candidatus Saccharibacteria bacterium]